MTSPNLLTFTGVTKRFGKHPVLAGVDLDLARGQVTVLLGTNGAGKSTLLKLTMGVLARDGGTLRVLGHDPQRDPTPVRERVGYVPAAPDVYPWMTPRQLFAFLAPHYPRYRIARAAALCGTLAVPLDRAFRSLSKGEAMKAMLVAALCQEPELLLLDEPFSGLDPLVREDVLTGVLGALRDASTTVLVATHELEIAARIADRVAILAHGKIARHDTLAAVLGQDEPTRIPEGLRSALATAERTELVPA